MSAQRLIHKASRELCVRIVHGAEEAGLASGKVLFCLGACTFGQPLPSNIWVEPLKAFHQNHFKRSHCAHPRAHGACALSR